MNIPTGANTGLAMRFLSTKQGAEWVKTKDYDVIYGLLGKFASTLDCYEIPQPKPIVEGIKFMIKEYSL